ncbi:xylulose 5-phosphate 3-epimerase [Bombilactobacillus bombi]|uniref:L-ribulose-5-phosphate 3-epimerase n=1 Tax=Bombilactobacillus bombi TaxID=1303590 RepID=A0A347SU07_9LACO|nr:L-ribulose-5-phosphate 3-epimerase [Bombilactobacillus bombi]RHW52080.1 xylulose 5-phosphate 3-epimerase [Bombilactobacillus bombi]
MTINALGIYEKALPPKLNWEQKFNLVHDLGFNFLEFSIDESDERLQRLDWSKAQRSEFRQAMWKTNSRINTLMLSGHRRFPLGSADEHVREQSLEIMQKAIDLAVDLGIRNIQLAGYDVYYEPKTVQSHELFLENLQKCVDMAAKKLVMLSIETMDDPFLNSLTKISQVKTQIKSPWLQGYPDLGNISAWPENDVIVDLENNVDNIAAIHLKDTKKVTPTFKGQFKEVPFGEGDVDFLGCLKALVRLGYSGSYTVEMWTESAADPTTEIKQAKLFFDQLFKQVGIRQEALN